MARAPKLKAEKATAKSITKLTAAEKKAAVKGQEFLLGSSIQPSQFITPGGAIESLGFVVAEAHRRTALSVADFNALPDADREALLADVVEALGFKPYVAPEAKPKKLATEQEVALLFSEIQEKLEGSTSAMKQPRMLRWAIKSLDLARAAAERHFTHS